MGPLDKPIVLSSHAQEQCRYRGGSEDDVVQAIRTAPWTPAELGRLECQWDVPFNRLWNGVHYAIKRVRPIFVEEPAQIVVVTVYVYYF